MGKRRIRSVAILGGGPAGASLATYLARAGLEVTLFSAGKRPPIIVGESLVPAIVPFLRELGIEEEVRSYSVYKGGATFVLGRDEAMSFRFYEVRGAATTYSYNVPRDKFDESILDAARRAGAHVVAHGARVERVGDSDRVRLSDETLAAASDVLSSQPDFIVDAGGRRRVLPRLMGVEAVEGERKDTALHAHIEGVEVEIPGNVHTDRLEHGWCWRIPLPGRVSLGFVVDTEYIMKFGNSPEEQFDNYIRHDPVISPWAAPATRVTPVVKYTNYQLCSARGVGANWALVGDTFGFVDPVFSSGVLIALQSAELLSRAILSGSDRAFQRYEREVSRIITAWQQVIGLFYNGRLLTMFKVGQFVRKTRLGRVMDFHFSKYMPRIFTGEAATSRYSLGLVRFMANYGLIGNDPRELEIR
ncbi:MAG: NAD(P)/FAD-dependent oxidoreductase [Proteobacteria bacterium]|nr:NAD(P)/FAD-dependent oxidoreductase [Pseudomonadota bacterium]